MADQNNLTIGGIGSDPSGKSTQIDYGWVGNTQANEAVWEYRPSSSGIFTDPGASVADATDIYYSKEIAIPAGMKIFMTYHPASGDAQITSVWQWYNPTGESFGDVVPGTAASQTGGTWTDIGSNVHTANSDFLYPSTTGDVSAMLNARKWRVKMTVTDAGSDGVAAGLVTAAVDAFNHASTGCYIAIQDNRLALNNSTISNPVTFGGIGADPS